ncbi:MULTISPECIES: M56 family metallopeptidase [unclassified Tenacibaculum]|uniref:M56 family metallopeptidase n=1 Tax=unclassified Tenacibaculum TaxID=2635139 RepID=UPI001F1802FF|nr:MULTISPECIES: M56 family metallopeptidase [unclassified Tenacibaculum]MCF2875457.1 M56 family metallopeptidase [Tenacibaculum sp. Cn5-1]MCF2935533.1 M56 family metallopeptidase [Tenacibaculum sp. Cn5-34]MCG7512093.1 M56 family metallopeptidase [Tenacibaculum sp. Cn5-46]
MASYLIKSGICLAVLLLFYHLVLEREKIHQFNRFYLLGSIVFSFVAPLFVIYTQVSIEVTEAPAMLNYTIVDMEPETSQESPINYWNIALGFSVFISLLLTIRFGYNLYRIYKKITSNIKVTIDKAHLILVDDLISPYTFWNYIFINKEEYNSQKIEDELFTHELTHVTQRHTIDVLLIEILRIVFWFNPLFYFLKKSIQLNHEFIADGEVINNYKNISEYQYLLLNKATWNNDYYLASNLNYSLTKKRLVMMSTKTSKVNNWLKKLAVIPLLTGSIYAFAERVEIYEKIDNSALLEAEISKDFKTPILKIDSKTNKYYLNNRLIKLDDLKKEFLLETNGKKSDLKIETDEDLVVMSLIKDITKILTKKYLSEIHITDNKYILGDTSSVSLETKNNSDYKSTPEYHYLKQTFWIKDKSGKKVSKKYHELSDYYKKKWLLFPTNPESFKALSKSEFNNLKNADVYVVRINGVIVNNSDLNKYKTNDFVTFSSRKISKYAKLKQQYHYNLLTKEGFNSYNLLKELQQQRKTSKQSITDNISPVDLEIAYNKNTVSNTKTIKNDTLTEKSYKEYRYRNMIVRKKDKNGKLITRKYHELTDEEKRQLPPPPPLTLKKKKVSKNLLEKLKNGKEYAIWIDGKHVNNDVLNKYNNNDFATFSGSFVYNNARSKKFPQSYQYSLSTHTYFDAQNKKAVKNYDNWKQQNSESVKKYHSLNNSYEKLRNQKPHYINSSKKRKAQLDNTFSKLGSLYFKLSRTDKKRVRRAINPIDPYVAITKNNSTYYKLRNELTEEDKKLLPPPPPKPVSIKVKKEHSASTPTSAPSNFVKKGETSMIPPPPAPMTAKEFVFRYPKATYFFNNKKVSHEEVIKITKNTKDLRVVTKDVNNKKVIKFTTKKYASSQKKVSIDKIDKLTNEEILQLPKGSSKNTRYYLNNKPITKAQLDKIPSNKIESIYVKREKGKPNSIYATSKQFATERKINSIFKNSSSIDKYYLNKQLVAKEDIEKLVPNKIESIYVVKAKDNSKAIYATSRK